MRHPWSISLRLTLWFGAIVFLGWLLFGAAMWLNLRDTLVSERHSTLTRRELRLEKLLTSTQSASEDERQRDFSGFAKATGNGLCEVYRADGRRAYPSPTPAATEFPWPSLRTAIVKPFEQVSWSGQAYWVLETPFRLGDEPLSIMVAAPENGNDLVLANFLTGLWTSIPVLLLVSMAGGYFLSRRALLPVDRITASARSISITNLSERLPIVNTGDELERLAETCNDMLERLEKAVNRIKQFTADASHDLRGPLFFVRTVAEVALRNPGIDGESRQAFADIVDEVARTSVLLESLLTLARADAGEAGAPLVPLNLRTVVEEACEMARPLAAERQHRLSIALDAGRPVCILGDFDNLRRLFWILLDNAFKYTPSPGRVDITLNASEHEATITVSDNGVGISEKDLPRIFDRFYRADPSRSHVEGSGLGLSIARWIAEIHHAQVSVASEESVGTAFGVKFPLYAGRCPQ